MRIKTMSRLCQSASVILFTLFNDGCAIHYFDSETGTEHIWGFGHMQMKVAAPNEGVRAIVRGTETVGVAVGVGEEMGYALLGWQQLTNLYIVDTDTAVRLEWPSSDFFEVRVGTEFPFLESTANSGEESITKERER